MNQEEAFDVVVDRLAAKTGGFDLASVEAIHRDPDAFVGFVRKPQTPRMGKDGKPIPFESIGSKEVSNLHHLDPDLIAGENTYMTVNDYHRTAPWVNRLTGLPGVWRKEQFLKRLSACYVDLDVGRPDSEKPEQRLTWREAMAEAGKLMSSGVLPQASLFARSGRGLYIFWLLRDEKDSAMAPRSWPEKIVLYKQINRALTGRLSHLAADPVAKDAARVLRTPGSYHTGAEKDVQYIKVDESGPGPLYTLKELAEILDVNTTEVSLPDGTRKKVFAEVTYGRETKERGTAPNRRHGAEARAALRAQDIVTIETERHGFKHDIRRRTLTIYGEFLRDSGAKPSEILKALQAMAENCQPSYPSDEDDQPVETIAETIQKSKPRFWSNEKLLKLWGITPDNEWEFNLLTILSAEVREKRKTTMGGKDPSDPVAYQSNRSWKRGDRHHLIRDIVESNGGSLPLGGARGMTRRLREFGLKTNRVTVGEDIKALGYQLPRPGRPKKQE